MTDKVMMAPTKVTVSQLKWLKKKAKASGETIASVVRGLIQKGIDAEKNQRRILKILDKDINNG